MNKRKILTMLLTISYICIILCGCFNRLTVFEEINNYGVFIKNLYQYSENKEENNEDNSNNNTDEEEDTEHKEDTDSNENNKQEEDNDNDENNEHEDNKEEENSEQEDINKPPTINGFSLLFDCGFDYAESFSGEYAFVIYEGQNCILHINGDLFTSADLRNYTVIDDKIIYTNKQKLGVTDIFGKIILSADFDEIEIQDDTILARKGNLTNIYTNDKLVLGNIAGKVNLFTKDFLLTDIGLRNLDMTPLLAGGFNVLAPIKGDIFLINDGMLFGCADFDLNVIVQPIHSPIYNYDNDLIFINNMNEYQLLNKDGYLIFSSNDIQPLSYDGKYLFYEQNRQIGIMNSEFQKATEQVFSSIYNNKSYNDYIIVGDNTKNLYSLKTNEFYEISYKQILPFTYHFICQEYDGQTFTLKNKYLNTLIEDCTVMQWLQNKLLIKNDNLYYFYGFE